MHRRILSVFGLFVVAAVVLLSDGVFATETHETRVFGPSRCTRGKTSPQICDNTFNVINPGGSFRIHLQNGTGVLKKGTVPNGLSSVVVSINGRAVIDTSDVKRTLTHIYRSLPAGLMHKGSNAVKVRVASNPGGYVTVEIFGTDQDSIPPLIDVVEPADGSTIETLTPLVRVAYSDDWLGVDLSTFYVEIDGEDFTGRFAVGAAEASYQLAAEEALGFGEHTVVTGISDVLGNSSEETSTFTVADVVPPEIHIVYPETGTTIETSTPEIRVTYSDVWSGIDTYTFYVEIDGQDFTYNFTVGVSEASYQLTSDEALTDGEHTIIAGIQDMAMNASSDTSAFTVSTRRLRAIAEAVPTSGYAPLTVLFKERGEDPSGTIEEYRWDFEGDGAWDTYDRVALDHTFTYLYSGTYSAVLQVTSGSGETAEDSVEIAVLPTAPIAQASADPSNGQVPLTVLFTGSGTDPDGYITLYEWDFDGNGVYDWSSSVSGNTTHIYTEVGTYSAVFRVVDNAALADTAPAILTEVRANVPGAPTATATASPDSGVAPLTVNLTGVGTDPEGNIVLYEWDFDGDGIFDWSSDATGNTSYTYTLPGIYYAAFRVTDGDGLSGTDYVEITVEVNVALFIPNDTFDPYQGETAIIQTTLSAPLPIRLYLKTKEGQIIRRLVDNETRPAGTHEDIWDGRDEHGDIANDRPYYAVLEYFRGGTWHIYDLTNTTGGDCYLPTREPIGYPRIISPFSDSLLDIRFSTVALPRYLWEVDCNPPEFHGQEMGASEITCFVGYLWSADRRIRTIVDRMPFPAGSHVLWWDGLDDEGERAQAPIDDSLILGCWGYTLPDNAIFLTGGRPLVSNVEAEPNYYSGFSDACPVSEEGIDIIFDISETATVTVKVFSLPSGSLVRDVMIADLPAGANSINWDGMNRQGRYVDFGDYEVGVVAKDPDGNQSIMQYTLVRFIH